MYIDMTRKKKKIPGRPRLYGLLCNKRAQVRANRKTVCTMLFFYFLLSRHFILSKPQSLLPCQRSPSKSISCTLKCPSKGTSSPALLATPSLYRLTFPPFLFCTPCIKVPHFNCRKQVCIWENKIPKQQTIPEKKKINEGISTHKHHGNVILSDVTGQAVSP